MKILITTGIYPPQIGGPAQYALNLGKTLREKGIKILLKTYKLEKLLPTGIRHLVFFVRSFFGLIGTDFCIALDTFSVGWPSVLAAKILGKKIIIRTGGDFLWESYVERTGDLVLLRDFYFDERAAPRPISDKDMARESTSKQKMNIFYKTRMPKFSLKEKIIFKLTRWTLQNASRVVFSTKWQKEMFEKAYGLTPSKNFIIENFYGKKVESPAPNKKNYLAFTRPLKWKNIEVLKRAFGHAKGLVPEIILDDKQVGYEESIEKMKRAYAAILVSLGDISPNMILDAVRCNKPFICTRETGIYDRIKDIGIFVDPKNELEIAEKIVFLSKPDNYEIYKKKIENFNFTHSWEEIAQEFLDVASKI